MTVIWLIVWLIWHTPQVEMFGSWNSWGTPLLVCLAIDLVGALGAGSRRRRETYFRGFGRPWPPGSGWSDDEPHRGAGTP